MRDKKEPVLCDNCRKEIKDMYYYIGDNGVAMHTENNIFRSEECLLEYFMVDCGFLDTAKNEKDDSLIEALLRGDKL